MINYNLEMKDNFNNDYNYKLNYYNNVQKNNYFTGNRNKNFEGGIQNYKMFSEQNKRIKNLNDLEKEKINNVLSNKIISLKKKQVNKIPYLQNYPNNLNYNKEDIRNEQRFKNILKIKKIKNNKIHNNNNNKESDIYDSNIVIIKEQSDDNTELTSFNNQIEKEIQKINNQILTKIKKKIKKNPKTKISFKPIKY